MESPFIYEEWRNLTKIHIPNLRSDDMYKVSNIGRVFNNYTQKVLPQNYTTNGYLKVSLLLENKSSNSFYVHRLVGLVFLGDSYSETNNIINHKNGIKDWNTINNLEWTTSSYNNKHAYDNNLKAKGENCTMAKLKECQVRQICSLLETNKAVSDIVKEVGGNVLMSDVYDIISKKCWVDISNNYNFYPGERDDNKRNFYEEKVRNLCQYFQDHPKPDDMTIVKHCEEALKACNYDYSWQSINTLRKIYTRYVYNSISKDYIF